MRTFEATVVAAVLLWTAIVLPAQESLDYTQWRGPHRDGGASSFVAPASWPDKLTFRWKTDVGEGYGTPLIVGGVVYAFTRRGTDETAAALDTGTGRQIWSSGYAVSYTPAAAAAEHGASPKATPAYCDGKLFTLGVTGMVTAFDATSGKRLWQTAPPAEAPDYGAASSPLCEKNLVIVHPGNYGPLTAFDAATGVVRWTAGGDGFFMSPIAADIDGVRQIVTVTQKEVIGVLPADGTVLWRYPWSGGGSGGTMPVLFNDTVIVSALDSGVVAIAPVRHGNEWTVATTWTTREVSMYVSNPVIAGDALFGLSHRARGQYFALDAKTGKTLWLGPPRQATNTAVVRAGELLFLLNDDGELIVATSSRSGFDPLKRYTVATSATWAQPAISGNRILVKDVSSITLWTVD